MCPTEWGIEQIAAQHETAGFDCGEPSLNDYLTKHALANARSGIGRTYVAVSPESTLVLGYYTISAGSIATELAPKKARSGTPYQSMPVLHLGRLAVRSDYQHQGIGECLLMHAMGLAERMADDVGVQLLEVQALHEKARIYYERFDFEALQDDPLHLYLRIKKIRTLGLNES